MGDVPREYVKWTPTDAQYAAYKAREVEICLLTIKRWSARGSVLRHGDTLFSADTWMTAARVTSGGDA